MSEARLYPIGVVKEVVYSHDGINNYVVYEIDGSGAETVVDPFAARNGLLRPRDLVTTDTWSQTPPFAELIQPLTPALVETG
ncbi:MAG: hypothetical protein O3B87_02725 [bacterium]|nr:hypothetical protein [bacterium]